MHRLYLVVLLTFFATASCSVAGAADLVEPALEIRPILPAGLEGSSGVIGIPTDDIEEFWAHIVWPGHEGEQVYITGVSWQWNIEPIDGAQSSVTDWLVEPGMDVTVCDWFPWNIVRTVGTPCTYIYFQADVCFDDAAGKSWGPIWSNTVTKHIVPEPASFAALGIGLLTAAGFVTRRRK